MARIAHQIMLAKGIATTLEDGMIYACRKKASIYRWLTAYFFDSYARLLGGADCEEASIYRWLTAYFFDSYARLLGGADCEDLYYADPNFFDKITNRFAEFLT